VTTFHIAVIPGDGIGKEVVPEGIWTLPDGASVSNWIGRPSIGAVKLI
jgi:isocitrate/isopropylmalate dehydrogenase